MKFRDEIYITIFYVNFKYLQPHLLWLFCDLAMYKVRLCRDTEKIAASEPRAENFLITSCCDTFWRNRSKHRDWRRRTNDIIDPYTIHSHQRDAKYAERD